jgi:NAD(P)-dependent dehydrogenase (short-subunit alcohol dehydrogenase family)
VSDSAQARKLAGKLALVTGASRGLGRAVALAFASEGAHVIALARTVGALEELNDEIRARGGTATLVPLDLADFAGIDRLGAPIGERWGKLDILVANAGILGALTPIAHLEPKLWSSLIDINVTANLRLIRVLDPLLRGAEGARAIFVTSSVAREPRAYWGGYAATKAALETLVRTYAQECARTGVRVLLVNPGPTRTRMRAQAMPGEDPMTLPAPEEVAALFLALVTGKDVQSGAIYEFRAWRKDKSCTQA